MRMMNTTIKTAVALAILAFSVSAAPEEQSPEASESLTLEVDVDRLVKLHGGVDSKMIFTATEELETLAEESSEPIYIDIDSPGGTVIGLLIVHQIKKLQSRGIQVHCYVDRIAASMAFVILNACGHRYVYEDSFLLWHSASVGLGGSRLKAKTLESILTSLAVINAHMKALILRETGISSEFYDAHDDADTLWPAAVLLPYLKPGYMKIINNVVRSLPVEAAPAE